MPIAPPASPPRTIFGRAYHITPIVSAFVDCVNCTIATAFVDRANRTIIAYSLSFADRVPRQHRHLHNLVGRTTTAITILKKDEAGHKHHPRCPK